MNYNRVNQGRIESRRRAGHLCRPGLASTQVFTVVKSSLLTLAAGLPFENNFTWPTGRNREKVGIVAVR